MRRVRGASLHEIERVYRERFDELRRVAAAIAGDGDAAFEIVQEAFAGVVARRRSFADRGPVDAWIWRAVVNTALNRRRRDRRSTGLPPPGPNGHASEHPLAADVHDRLARLPERQRLALFLRYYADLDYAEIADVLGTSVGTVSSTLHAARLTLRAQLEEVTQ
jgi:RNA polymerase sigma factor (sigma-70 family)